MKNKKALVSDIGIIIQWGIILIFVLAIFSFFFFKENTNMRNDVLVDVEWEAGWASLSVTNSIMENGQTLSEFLTENEQLTDNQKVFLETHLKILIDEIQVRNEQEKKVTSLFVVHDDEVYCFENPSGTTEALSCIPGNLDDSLIKKWVEGDEDIEDKIASTFNRRGGVVELPNDTVVGIVISYNGVKI